jgi:hypothetical protein
MTSATLRALPKVTLNPPSANEYQLFSLIRRKIEEYDISGRDFRGCLAIINLFSLQYMRPSRREIARLQQVPPPCGLVLMTVLAHVAGLLEVHS